jgi:hypothetical protein
MAVTTTVQDIVTGAMAKSKKNRPGDASVMATELARVVTRAHRGLYAFAARINPTYFATQLDVAFASGGWARPASAESIFRIEQAGAEVVTVPFDDRGAEKGKPALYELGQLFRSAGNALDPVSGTLTFFFSTRPADYTALATVLDALWVEAYNELLMLEVAVYLALQDGRTDEAGALKAERDRWAVLFAAHLEHATINQRRRFGMVRYVNSNNLVPIGSLLAGGSTIQVGA